MPARLDLTPEQRLEREAARREQSRVGMARLRAERKAETAALANALANGAAALANAAPSSTHAGTSRSPEGSPSENLSTSQQSDVERIRLTLEPFAARGYVHNPAFWALLAERFPRVDLVFQAYKAAHWLRGPKGKGRQCSEPFLANWIEGAERRAGPRPPRPRATSAFAGVLQVIADAGD